MPFNGTNFEDLCETMALTAPSKANQAPSKANQVHLHLTTNQVRAEVLEHVAWFLLALLVYPSERERRSDERGARSPAMSTLCARLQSN